MPSISTLPAHPIPGKPFKLMASALAEGGKIRPGNVVRIWCTAAPPGSRYRKELDESQATRVKFATVDVGRPHDMTLDKGGGYVLLLEELQRGGGFGGGYQYDTRGAPTEEIVQTATTTLYLASPINCQLGFGQHTATLRLFVSGGNILATTVDQHGLVTPSIEVTAQTSAKARAAAESSTVLEQLGELVGAASTVLGSPATVIANLIDSYEGHRGVNSAHQDPDNDNVVGAGYTSLDSVSSQSAALSVLRLRLSRHIQNIDPDSQSQAVNTEDYHTGVSWNALPSEQCAPSDDPLTVVLSAADTWRSFEAHRVSSVHDRTDRTNAAAALPPLLELHRLFIEQLATPTPTTPPTSHSALALLASSAGFKDS